MSTAGFVSQVTESDIPALVTLINSAYRGESSKQGWTTEADLLDGQRTDEESMKLLLLKPGSVFLEWINEEDNLCVCESSTTR